MIYASNLCHEIAQNVGFTNLAEEIINEDELLELLQERTDLSFITDIPPKRHEDFKSLLGDRYFAPPKKMGAQTAEANANAGLASARQIVKFFATGDRTFQVNE